ncbi:hypothetical protein RJD24_04520 [Bacillaceae bacterium IKA-2]|jgi:hypothetical protein|nr:hypothetical protein RJD24_04520 [Bacillaceae bacterium IKA-2]
MERKKIIVDELKYWKKSRLLPERYCDFLLTLYTGGVETGDVKPKQKKISSNQLALLSFTTIGLAIFGLTFLVIYFTDFSLLMQMTIVFFLSAVMFALGKQVKKYDGRFVHLYILMTVLMLFLATIHSVSLIFLDKPGAIMLAVIFTCLVWIIIGKKYNLKYLLFSGAIGLLVAIYFLLS